MSSRRGFAMMYALVCLGLATMIGISLTRLVGAAREQQQQACRHAQVNWLMEAARERALARLQHDPQYTGEHWLISEQDWPHRDAALVEISLTPPVRANTGQTPTAPPASPQSLTITAQYPLDKTLTVRRTQTFPLPRP